MHPQQGSVSIVMLAGGEIWANRQVCPTIVGVCAKVRHYFRNHRFTRSGLDCGGPPPLFPEAYKTVPMLIHRKSSGSSGAFPVG
jgi:hypothetical protein